MIYLVRHGETNWNKEGRIQGRKDPPLNMNGIKQAMEKRDLFKDHHINFLYTSPLKRAVKTADILTAKAKVDHYIATENLIEYDFGQRDGLTFEEDAKLLEANPDADLGEEDEERFIRRLSQILIEAGLKEGNIMLVSHGAVISTILRMLLPDHPNEYFMLKNNSICCIENKINSDGNLELTLKAVDASDEELEEMLSQND